MEIQEITIARPIPQQQIYFDNLSSSSSVVTPSSLSFEMNRHILTEQSIHFGCPPPDSNPIPFGSVDFSNFHADFTSPTQIESNDFSEEFSEDNNTFNYRL
ncbi:hypothetical protein EDI_127820 [Entamoeba dispar SAW760]|uniref:Uncharacterized protein n=1 Tax=Entamoeba dispar (strain ATCC PRA-260 / SAW760) TaxID=370354 RepID=B0EK70_ENTDS|nr:uncharacterized protein EDI_127820 [Entamoeba dispar SAW760]EDR25078.1 hypothetical protein EDI_127820 [Entamoeba dispar SAW760]|eukprot:EDR25078.1 hypothetical protein EDI_127820 [Entamoeba dispar SAW760]